jgi:hypothetical protein
VVRDRGLTWYVEKRVLDRLPEDGAEIEIHMGDHGKWRIGIEPLPCDPGTEPETRWFPPADPYMPAYKQGEETQE